MPENMVQNGGDYVDYCLPEYDNVLSGKGGLMFQRNLLLPLSTFTMEALGSCELW
jgi:hypothetical protein